MATTNNALARAKVFVNEPAHKAGLVSHHNKVLSVELQAQRILAEVMKFRRLHNDEAVCSSYACNSCCRPHLEKVSLAVSQNKPVTFILPAFPGKSPNPEKVLGVLPDMAERLSLQFLNQLCLEVRKIYAPGARIILCSDGRVFSDIVGISEEHIDLYQKEIDQIINDLQLTELSTFHLDAISEGRSFSTLREELVSEYGNSIESIRQRVKSGSKNENSEDQELHRMYCGLTRFLVEDSYFPGQKRSRSSIQKECKARSYKVIQRSNAWTAYIAARFPQSVRLSIHPQSCGSLKLGIQLIGKDSWMTPWHGVAVETASGFVLMKHWEAKEQKAELIYDKRGLPSHFKLVSASKFREIGKRNEL